MEQLTCARVEPILWEEFPAMRSHLSDSSNCVIDFVGLHEVAKVHLAPSRRRCRLWQCPGSVEVLLQCIGIGRVESG